MQILMAKKLPSHPVFNLPFMAVLTIGSRGDDMAVYISDCRRDVTFAEDAHFTAFHGTKLTREESMEIFSREIECHELLGKHYRA